MKMLIKLTINRQEGDRESKMADLAEMLTTQSRVLHTDLNGTSFI